jgi:DNA-binding NtrC family response regulator
VLEAGDAGSAQRAAAAHPGKIHLLLTDVLLPNGSGPDLADRLASARPDMRILFMSGYADDALLTRARGAAGEFLAKPFTPDVLSKRVRDLLDAK